MQNSWSKLHDLPWNTFSSCDTLIPYLQEHYDKMLSGYNQIYPGRLNYFIMKKVIIPSIVVLASVLCVPTSLLAQPIDSTNKSTKQYKNVIRYNLSGALIFGFSRNIIFGYERVIGKNQSISVNFGKVSFPDIVAFSTDSVSVNNDIKNGGTNFSIDWRFYLSKENKYAIPHGIYIGPYYSYNTFNRENNYAIKRASGTSDQITTRLDFDIHTIGVEMGYQFVLWKRLALDFVLVGPGMSSYKLTAKYEGSLSDQDREKLGNAVEQLITQKFPGMNFVLGEKELNANGIIDTWDIGFRYLIHIGFLF